MKTFLKIFVSAVCGALASLGVGGGSLLIIFLTNFMQVDHSKARLTNLLAFVPAAMAASFINNKNGLIVKKAVLICALSGAVFAVGGVLLTNVISVDIIKKMFGGVLIAAGISELFRKTSQRPKEP